LKQAEIEEQGELSLDETQKAAKLSHDEKNYQVKDTEQDLLDEGEIDEGDDTNGGSMDGIKYPQQMSSDQHPSQQPSDSETAGVGKAELAGIPQNVLGGLQNEALKNLMISWYFAGYYTGLYEGQQQARPDAENASTRGQNSTG